MENVSLCPTPITVNGPPVFETNKRKAPVVELPTSPGCPLPGRISTFISGEEESDEGYKRSRASASPILLENPQVMSRGLNASEQQFIQRVERALRDSMWLGSLGVQHCRRGTYYIWGLEHEIDVQAIKNTVGRLLTGFKEMEIFEQYYFAAEAIAIFKPEDEVRGAVNAYSQHSSRSKKGIEPGWAVINELIAVELRRIPLISVHTTLSSRNFRNAVRKTGLLQQFITGGEPLSGIPSSDSDTVVRTTSSSQFQRMVIIDLSLCNADRKPANILYTKSNGISLIDQTLIIPAGFASAAQFTWIHWPQANQPFSDEALAEIDGLQFTNDAQVVLSNYPTYPAENLETMRIAYYLLKQGARLRLTPLQIGCFLIEYDWVQNSFMHKLYLKAKTVARNNPEDAFRILSGYIQSAMDVVSRIAVSGQNPRESITAIHNAFDHVFARL